VPDNVCGPQGIANANGDGFLTDRQVNGALYLVAGIDIGNAFFAASDKIQRAQ